MPCEYLLQPYYGATEKPSKKKKITPPRTHRGLMIPFMTPMGRKAELASCWSPATSVAPQQATWFMSDPMHPSVDQDEGSPQKVNGELALHFSSRFSTELYEAPGVG